MPKTLQLGVFTFRVESFSKNGAPRHILEDKEEQSVVCGG